MSFEGSPVWDVFHSPCLEEIDQSSTPTRGRRLPPYDAMNLSNVLDIRAFLLQYATGGKWQAGEQSRPGSAGSHDAPHNHIAARKGEGRGDGGGSFRVV